MLPTIKESIISRLQPQYKTSFDQTLQKFVIYKFSDAAINSDFLNKIKNRIKLKCGWLYPFLIALLSPVYTHSLIQKFLKSTPKGAFIVNLGSGTRNYAGSINVDAEAYDNVHVLASLDTLPFIDSSVDAIISEAVLEHVPDPAAHIREFLRILKPGGRIIALVPFMQPFHASPHDFQRYTDNGLLQLFHNFESKTVTAYAGPTSSLIWILQEWIAITFSFGSMSLYRLILPLTWVISPLKFLDFFLNKHPAARIAASGFCLTGTKPK